jgi:predicted  nucleic acid-binding Zn-ribbon protein
MAWFSKAAVFAVAACSASGNEGPSGGAMGKAISMLQDMAAKVKQEKNDEQVAFAKFKTWCAHEDVALTKSITADGEQIEALTTEIAELGEDIRSLGEAIAKLESDVEKYQATLKEKTAQREKDHKEFLADQKDFSESVDAVDRALETLESENYDRPASAAALLQLSDKKRMPAQVRSIISAFIGMSDDAGSPEANAYENQSGGIIDMLKKLRDDFRAKVAEVEKAEMNSEHAYNMIVQDLTDSTTFAKSDISEKSQEKGRKTEQKAEDEKLLAATTATKAQSEKTLATMTTECKEKGFSFDEKQQLREEEIEAIGKAVEILSSPEVAGQHEKHLQLAQERVGAASLVQLRAAVESPRVKVRQFIAAEGQRLHSKNLALLAQKMTADPFVKVKKMIDGMITRLLEEANADANHEGFCDAEIGKSKITRTKLQEDIDSLAAAVDEGKATILHLTNSIAALSKQVADIDSAVKEAAELRKSEKDTNAQTVEEAKLAQEKVQAATAVLKDFYAGAADATGFVQTAASAKGVPMGSEQWNSLANPAFKGEVDLGHKKGMQTFGKKYTGQQDSAGGVLALLEVILSDFANLEADTIASENQAQNAFEEFVTVSNKDKAVAEKQIEMESADKTTAAARLQQDTADWKATQDELLAAERYYDKLVPQCMDPGQTFEERTAARESEIQSLKEALTILGSEDIATSA